MSPASVHPVSRPTRPTHPTRPARQPWRLTSHRQVWFDRGVTLLLLAPLPLMVVSGTGLTACLLTAVQIGPLWWRRDHPRAVFLVVALASATQVLLLDTPIWGQVAFPVATYSIARFASARPAVGALGVALVASFVAAVDWMLGFENPMSVAGVLAYALPMVGIVVTAWALGTLGRTRRAYVDTLVERGERIEREAAQQVALAASDERARIAREMHDVVAHGLTVMVVQADGARYAAAHDPAVATETLARIAATGREALTDMRQLLGLLRADEASGRSPLPGLADLPALVDDAGEHVSAELDGLDRPVPTATGLTAYRVVQEALTNVRKHAGPGAHAAVHVTVSDQRILVRVTDDGRGAGADPETEAGHGLLGMRERVDVHGGTLVVGPRSGGGYLVEATVPL